ncbi:MAG: TerC family protein [Proteobacteria bacterium]|nr:TerC family protein [Pseudomonadota bacterium]MDA1131986.1 TerC family protein [Pseudomonadota bacterium]
MNIFDPQIVAAFLTLSALEIVLAIDNLIFLSVLTQKLPPDQAQRARVVGLAGALVLRLLLLASIVWITRLTAPIFVYGDWAVSWRDVILAGGGLFLLYKGTFEIHDSVEGEDAGGPKGPGASFAMVIAQIMVLDIVFSLDSVITAVGMVDQFAVMAAAVIVAIAVMVVAAKPVGDFVANHPTVKMLALSFLLLVGVALVADGLHFHIPRGYIYFAIAFSAGVEALNLLAARRRKAKRAAG